MRKLLNLAWVPLLAILVMGLPMAQAAEVHEHAMGSADAPVTIIEYSSLTCPHCAAFQKETFPGLKAKYIDTGKVRFIARDFPLDQYALQAAVIAHCAGDDRYFTFVDALFATQDTWARAKDPTEALKQLARLGGLAPDALDACLADKSMADAVLQSELDAQKQYNVESTPTFIVNGKAYPGERSLDSFAEIIDPLLVK
jgi:protein-disulfide isomerase